MVTQHALPMDRHIRTLSRARCRLFVCVAVSALLTGCLANMPTMPTVGQGNSSTTVGAVAGGNTQGANETLERCAAPLGVLRIEEDSNSAWYRYYGSRLGSTTPLLSLMIQQSNCFVVVEICNLN